MRTLIIPDIHNKYPIAESVIDKEKHDQVLFLGDYFDSYYDGIEDADNTAAWLSRSLNEKNRIHLIGNHDISYMTDNPKLKCSGYTKEKHLIIRNHKIDWKKLQLYYWLDESTKDKDQWLCTHAGLSYKFYVEITKSSPPSDVMEFAETDLKNIDETNYNHRFFQAGKARRGSARVGGILWCDYYEEFEPIPDLKQIFGHTPLESPSHLTIKDIGSEHICLDTGLNHYAIYDNGKMVIKSISKM